jgi:hypothetical protein
MSTASKQEIKVDNVKATLVNPLMEEFNAAVTKQEIHDPDLTGRVAMWNAFVIEARMFVAKLVLTLENSSINVSPFVTTALAHTILSERIPQVSRIVPGLMESNGKWIPQLYIKTAQPPELLPELARIWGPAHPFAQEELVTDMQAMPLSHLSDCLILNQVVKVGLDSRSLAYNAAARRVLNPSKEFLESAFGPSDSQKPILVDYQNFVFVAEQPQRFLKWAVSKEIRDTIYPQIVSLMKSDPSQVEYIRISDDEVKRIVAAQKELVDAAESATADKISEERGKERGKESSNDSTNDSSNDSSNDSAASSSDTL